MRSLIVIIPHQFPDFAGFDTFEQFVTIAASQGYFCSLVGTEPCLCKDVGLQSSPAACYYIHRDSYLTVLTDQDRGKKCLQFDRYRNFARKACYLTVFKMLQNLLKSNDWNGFTFKMQDKYHVHHSALANLELIVHF